MSWSDEARAWVKAEFKNGASASEISARLTVAFPGHPPKTRNAVIGVVNRGGLRRADRVVKSARMQSRRRAQQQRAKRVEKLGAAVDASKVGQPDAEMLAAIAVMDADDASPRVAILIRNSRGEVAANDGLTDKTCRWPRGNPLDLGAFGFCDKQAVPGLPYCACHSAKAFQPRQDKRRQVGVPAVRQAGPEVEMPASGQRRETEVVS